MCETCDHLGLNFSFGTKKFVFFIKKLILNKDIPDPEDECNSPECCTGHVGLEYGGSAKPTAFYASTENSTYTKAEYGRLNRPNDKMGGIGGWMSKANDHNPWLQVNIL